MNQQAPGPQQPYPPQYTQQPQYTQPVPPPAKKTKKWPWIVGGIVLLLIIGALANGGRPANPNTTAGAATTSAAAPTQAAAPQQPPAAAKRVVVYEVTGAGSAMSISYNTDGVASIEQVQNVKLPWSKQLELPAGQALQTVTVFAQAGADTPEIAVKITVDGKLVKDGKSSGPYSVVNVSENIGTLGK